MRLVTQTINDLYFVVNVEGVSLSWLTLVKGGLIGIGAALLAALPPRVGGGHRRAGRRHAPLRDRSDGSRGCSLMTGGAVALLLAGLLLLLFPADRSIVLAFVALFAIILAFALFTPLVTVGLMRLVARPVARLGLLGRMAPRDITRALSRTSVAIAALMVAVSVIIGVSVMIGSFRSTVNDWLAATLQADIYISPPSIAANRSDARSTPPSWMRWRASRG